MGNRRLLIRIIGAVCCLLLALGYLPGKALANGPIRVEEHIFRTDALEMAYLLYLPEDFDPAENYRLVLFMHGAGDRGFDFGTLHNIDYGFVTTFRSNGEYYEKTILLVPQCPEPYLWVDDVWDAGAYTMKPQPSAPIAAVKQLCEYVIDEYAVDRTRIYAVGVSMGGMAVWDMLARYPSFFAAAAPICGCLDEAQVEAFAKTPIFTANDPRDTIIRSQPTIRVVEKLQSLGADILYKQYDAGIRGDTTYYHASWIDAYSLDTSDNNLYRFIFSRQRQWQAGDMDGDGAITQEDAVYLLLHTMFEDYPLRYGSADVDGNEGVDREDALYLLLRTLFGESFYPI